MTTVELGGLTFNGTRTSYAGLFFRRLIDWDGVPASKSRYESRPRAHGSYGPSAEYREGVAASVEGYYQGTSRADALTTRRRMTGALARDGLVMAVTDELGVTQREVSVRRAKLDEPVGSRFTYAIDTFARDPRRYGPEATSLVGLPVAGGGITWPLTWPLTWAAGGSDGRLTIENPGSTETFSVFEVTGGLSGFSITEVGTGREIRVDREVPLGSVVRVDQRTGRVTIDGTENDISGSVTRDEWFPIPPAGTSVVQFNPIGSVVGTPTLIHRTRPAYW